MCLFAQSPVCHKCNCAHTKWRPIDVRVALRNTTVTNQSCVWNCSGILWYIFPMMNRMWRKEMIVLHVNNQLSDKKYNNNCIGRELKETGHCGKTQFDKAQCKLKPNSCQCCYPLLEGVVIELHSHSIQLGIKPEVISLRFTRQSVKYKLKAKLEFC